MPIKKDPLKFTVAMFMFYFLNTSLINWINGLAFKNLFFYSSVLIIDALVLIYIIKIIKSPHIVKSRETKTPTVLLTIAILVCLILLTEPANTVGFLDILYLFLFLSSMAFLINWYKKTGIIERNSEPNSIIYDDYNHKIVNQIDQTESEIEKLKILLKKALLNTKEETKEYNQLKQCLNIVNAIIEVKVRIPNNIISQIKEIINSYNYLLTMSLKTSKVEETLEKITNSFPIIIDGLTAIYNSGIEQNLIEIEVETETLNKILKMSNLEIKTK